jgi:hypothetical protein
VTFLRNVKATLVKHVSCASGTYIHQKGTTEMHWMNTENGKERVVYVGFEVLTAVVMKSTVFWDIPLCSP